MITPSFGLTATERVLPKLALDFTTASLDSRITFTRALNTATRVNNSGVIEIVNADTPRFDYNPVTLACKGLLIEEARTNLLTYSNDFRNTADAGSTRPWIYSNVTLSTDQIVSPDGTQNADKLIEDTATNAHYIYQSPTLTDNTVYTNSVYAKKGSKSIVVVAIITKSGGQRGRLFNLDTGTSSALTATGWTTSPSGYGIEDAGNGWYRCWVSHDVGTGAVTGNYRVLMAQDAATISFTGSTDNYIYVWGAQTEAGAFPTSIIPTTSSTLTRNADVATMTGTNFSDWFNASEGSFYVSGKLLNQKPGFRGIIAASDGTSTNYIAITQASNSYSVRGSILDTNVSQASLVLGNTSDNTKFKATLGYKLNLFAGSLNAANPVIDTSGTIPTVSQLNIGYFGTSQQNVCYIENIFYWPQQLTDAEIQSFSK